MILTIRCLMTEREFDKLICLYIYIFFFNKLRVLADSSRSTFIVSVIEHINKYGYSGVEFRCDDLIRGIESNRKNFSTFLRQLYQKLNPSVNNVDGSEVRSDSLSLSLQYNKTISIR